MTASFVQDVVRSTATAGLATMAAMASPGGTHAFDAASPTPAAAITTATMQGPQGELAVSHAGAGTGLPVLFLHGDSSRAAQWDEVMTLTAKQREVVAFDFRGHGDSAPAADGDYGYDGRAADVDAVANAFGFEAFIIVAHSGGGAVALAYAAAHPDKVAGILLVDPATDPRALPQEIRNGFVRDTAGPRSLEVQQAYFASIVGENQTVRERVLADTESVDPIARAGVAKTLAEWDPEPTLHAYTGPMLILATEVTDTPAALYRLRPDIPHRVVADVGHWVQLEKPELVADAIEELAAQIEPGAAGVSS